MSKEDTPKFDKRIFWDVDESEIDLTKDANWLIIRVFERGDVPDIRMCRKYYGDERIGEVLLNAKSLMKHTLYLAAAVLGKEIEDFRCYKLRQLNPELYPY